MRLGETPMAGRLSSFPPGASVGGWPLRYTIVGSERLTPGEAVSGARRGALTLGRPIRYQFAINSPIPLATWSFRRVLHGHGPLVAKRQTCTKKLRTGVPRMLHFCRGRLDLRPEAYLFVPSRSSYGCEDIFAMASSRGRFVAWCSQSIFPRKADWHGMNFSLFHDQYNIGV